MSGAFTDGAAAAERVLTKLRHDPTAITLTLGAPVVMVILFGYTLGSAIAVPGGDYRAFLIPGLFATIGANIVPSMFTMARDSSRRPGSACTSVLSSAASRRQARRRSWSSP